MPSRARRYGGRAPMSLPWKVILPARRGRRPMMLSMVVVFPAPLRTTRHTASCSPTQSDTWRKTWARPRWLSIPRHSRMAPPAHCIFDLLVLPDLLGGAAREDDPLVHDHDAIRVLEDDVHVVLDDHGRDPLRAHHRADDIHDGRLLSSADAAGGLVEEEEPRPERVCDRHVEKLALAVGDPARRGRGLGREPELAEDIEGLLPDRLLVGGERPEAARHPPARKDRERDVVEHRELVEEAHDLEAPRDA